MFEITQPVDPKTVAITVSSTSSPGQLMTISTKAHSITFGGFKAARTRNTGQVWIQFTSADGSTGLPLQAGQMVSVSMPDGFHFELSNIYIDVETANDGVTAIYW